MSLNPTFFVPDWDSLPDGVYEPAAGFWNDLESGTLDQEYTRREAHNALDEAKIHCWLQGTLGPGIPGCKDVLDPGP